jgi:hypothetical protein
MEVFPALKSKKVKIKAGLRVSQWLSHIAAALPQKER